MRKQTITSKDNPLIKEAISLRMSKYRRNTGFFMVEGEKMVTEAIRSGAAIVHIFASEPYLERPDGACLSERGYTVYPVSERAFRAMSGQETPYGVSAVCRIPVWDIDLVRRRRLMILDRVQDPGNVGAMHRICDAAGFDAMVCLTGCADPYGPKSVQAGMGAVFRVPVLSAGEGETDEGLVHKVKENGFRLAAGLLDHSARDALTWEPDEGPWALVIGNESQGVAPWLREYIDTGLYIPIYGGAESLNAAVAAGILAYRMAGRS